ncbi:MAG: baseplate J/gp47 family protein, partial [Candidatus Levybacteria bacterium]|nr:baseplate J/gp47 family protein [Candidatus Levybacteria bacterium]
MNLPFIKKFKKEIPPSYFLVLVLRDEKVNAVIFQEIEGIVKIIGQKEEHFLTSIDDVPFEEFLETLDKAISHAESSLPRDIQTQKTIFGVKDSWTENDQIKKEHLAKLKKTSEELDLVPIGFLVISQAISHLLHKEEGAPISAILAEVNKKSVTVTLVRAGKTIETKSSEIHESIPFTVDTLLKHFNVPEILPSRIIIFNGKEDLSQEFISHTWSKSLPFLHLPQITNLPHGFDAKAVLFGAATQMGFEVLRKDIPKEPHAIASDDKTTESKEEKIPTKNESQERKTYKNIGAEGFGFAKDIDVAKTPKITAEEEFREKEEKRVNDNFSAITEMPEDTSPVKTRRSKNIKNIYIKIISIIIAIFSAIFLFAKKINFKSIFNKMPRGKITVIIPALLFLVIALIASYLFLIKATVEITVDPKIIEQNRSVTFSATNNTDAKENIISGEFITTSEEGTVSTAATGKKDVGTNAKGAVTIFNTLQQSKTFPEGTIITSSNGLKFTLDSQVTVKAIASRSADEPPPPSQTATVNVTANQLGKESNFPSGTRFTLPNFDISEIAAKNDNPLEGGTKKEVTVISAADQTKLENDLPKQLESKAMDNLKNIIGKDKVLLPTFISNSLSKKSINVKVGEEAS